MTQTDLLDPFIMIDEKRDMHVVEAWRGRLIISSVVRNRLGQCPLCHSSIQDRKVTLFNELIDVLYHVYCWCGKNKVHEFKTSDIKHMLDKNCYARFGDLVRFGGLIYRPKNDDNESEKAWFGINMGRAKEFFAGQREIPLQITLNQMTNEILESNYAKVNDFPSLAELINEQGLYDYELDLIN